MIKLIKAWIRIIRPPIVFISCFGVIVASLNAGIFLNLEISQFQFVMMILGAFLLSSGLMLHNDVTDLKSDNINRPHKPLSQGIIKVKTAYYTGIFFMILSIIISLFVNIKDTGIININCGVFTIILVIIGLYYNYYGKYHGIFGNMSVAFGVAAIPYWGSISVFPNELFVMLPLSLALFIMETGREIMVNIGDINGDIKAKFRTLPVQIGRIKSMYVSLIFYLLFIPLFILSTTSWLNSQTVFGDIYKYGGILFAFSLIITWLLTYKVVLKNDEKMIWNAFEKYERIGTRVMVIFFQIFLLMEVFY